MTCNYGSSHSLLETICQLMNERDVVTEAFTELAPQYRETMDKELLQYWGISYQGFVNRLVRFASVRPGETVLDLATGSAMIPIEIKSRSNVLKPVIGLDITPAMLTAGHKFLVDEGLSTSIWLVCASAMEIPFANDMFDVVLCGLGTHHMEVPRMLGEVRRILKSNGRLVIADVGATSFWRSGVGNLLLRILLLRYGYITGSARAQAEIEAFSNVRTANEWQTLLANLGFSHIHINQFEARRPWYPCALMLKAIPGS